MPLLIRPATIFVPYNGKVADIKEADTNKHTFDLGEPLSESRKILAVVLSASRISGSGNFTVYPNEGTTAVTIMHGTQGPLLYAVAEETNRVQYAQTVANDDFDVYCFGYIVQA